MSNTPIVDTAQVGTMGGIKNKIGLRRRPKYLLQVFWTTVKLIRINIYFLFTIHVNNSHSYIKPRAEKSSQTYSYSVKYSIDIALLKIVVFLDLCHLVIAPK